MRTDEIQLLSGRYSPQLDVIDEGLTTFLRPDFINRHKLHFSVNFPKPGKYKALLTFMVANRTQQAAFVIDVQ